MAMVNSNYSTKMGDPLGRGPKTPPPPPPPPVKDTTFGGNLPVGGGSGPMFPDSSFEGRMQSFGAGQQREEPPRQDQIPTSTVNSGVSHSQQYPHHHQQQNHQYPHPQTSRSAYSQPPSQYQRQNSVPASSSRPIQPPQSTRSMPVSHTQHHNHRPASPPPRSGYLDVAPHNGSGEHIPPSPMQIYMSSSNTGSNNPDSNRGWSRDQGIQYSNHGHGHGHDRSGSHQRGSSHQGGRSGDGSGNNGVIDVPDQPRQQHQQYDSTSHHQGGQQQYSNRPRVHSHDSNQQPQHDGGRHATSRRDDREERQQPPPSQSHQYGRDERHQGNHPSDLPPQYRNEREESSYPRVLSSSADKRYQDQHSNRQELVPRHQSAKSHHSGRDLGSETTHYRNNYNQSDNYVHDQYDMDRLCCGPEDDGHRQPREYNDGDYDSGRKTFDRQQSNRTDDAHRGRDVVESSKRYSSDSSGRYNNDREQSRHEHDSRRYESSVGNQNRGGEDESRRYHDSQQGHHQHGGNHNRSDRRDSYQHRDHNGPSSSHYNDRDRPSVNSNLAPPRHAMPLSPLSVPTCINEPADLLSPQATDAACSGSFVENRPPPSKEYNERGGYDIKGKYGYHPHSRKSPRASSSRYNNDHECHVPTQFVYPSDDKSSHRQDRNDRYNDAAPPVVDRRDDYSGSSTIQSTCTPSPHQQSNRHHRREASPPTPPRDGPPGRDDYSAQHRHHRQYHPSPSPPRDEYSTSNTRHSSRHDHPRDYRNDGESRQQPPPPTPPRDGRRDEYSTTVHSSRHESSPHYRNNDGDRHTSSDQNQRQDTRASVSSRLSVEIPVSPQMPESNNNNSHHQQAASGNNNHTSSRPPPHSNRTTDKNASSSNTSRPSSSSSGNQQQQQQYPQGKSPRIIIAEHERRQSQARQQIMKEIAQATNMKNSALDDRDRKFWERQIATLNESFKKL